jgi:hypothetical protein
MTAEMTTRGKGHPLNLIVHALRLGWVVSLSSRQHMLPFPIVLLCSCYRQACCCWCCVFLFGGGGLYCCSDADDGSEGDASMPRRGGRPGSARSARSARSAVSGSSRHTGVSRRSRFGNAPFALSKCNWVCVPQAPHAALWCGLVPPMLVASGRGLPRQGKRFRCCPAPRE